MFYMNFTYLLFALPGMLLAAWAPVKPWAQGIWEALR